MRETGIDFVMSLTLVIFCYFPGAHVCFFSLTFSKTTPEVRSAPSQNAPQMGANFSACLHITTASVELILMKELRKSY